VTCREFTEFLADYDSGELPAGTRACFEEHLAECPDCVAYLQIYQATIRLGKAACVDAEDPTLFPGLRPETVAPAGQLISCLRTNFGDRPCKRPTPWGLLTPTS
jgi:anti-sigma factor RsiW